VGVLFGAAGSNVRRKRFAHKSQLEPPKIRTDCVLNIISKRARYQCIFENLHSTERCSLLFWLFLPWYSFVGSMRPTTLPVAFADTRRLAPLMAVMGCALALDLAAATVARLPLDSALVSSLLLSLAWSFYFKL
jgi:hypothetical protein